MEQTMTENNEWITWSRLSRGRDLTERTITQLKSERQPTSFHKCRPATPEEIEIEQRKRAEEKQRRDEQSAFESRQDYQDARAIRQILEWMTIKDNPLSRLTPEEWKALRRKLEKE